MIETVINTLEEAKTSLYTCVQCGETKEWSAFVKDKREETGIRNKCMACAWIDKKNRIERKLSQGLSFENAPSLISCIRCGEEKPRCEFYVDLDAKNGVRQPCKECVRKHENSPEERAKNNVYYKEHHKSDSRKRMIKEARKRARENGILFSITTEDIYMPLICPALGIPIKVSNKYASDNSPSLDRIKPNLGYIPGNVAVISYKANRIKSDASPEELRTVLSFLRTYSSNKGI